MPVVTPLFLALGLAGPLPPPADHLLNPDFDTGMSDWRYYLDRGAGGKLEWDATRGSPAVGSARAGNIFHGDRYDAWGQCVKLAPGAFTLRAQVAAQVAAGNRCELRIAVLNQPDCNTTAVPLRDLKAYNTLNDGTFEAVTISDTAPGQAGAAWVFLGHIRVDAAAYGDSYCNFDHVELTGNAVFRSGFDAQ
ncbi:hypothetical protein [Tahibacter soli]|uniref:Uncharacterized protein n=1 Tax=Tahibacter soli TaxID=2983605 RepID=A0A9X3YLR3_9GAMM|nr:hypothetical protein [Tahibacter soli]MDC8014751.1 hypothetical protein [Tahibacter soli]